MLRINLEIRLILSTLPPIQTKLNFQVKRVGPFTTSIVAASSLSRALFYQLTNNTFELELFRVSVGRERRAQFNSFRFSFSPLLRLRFSFHLSLLDIIPSCLHSVHDGSALSWSYPHELFCFWIVLLLDAQVYRTWGWRYFWNAPRPRASCKSAEFSARAGIHPRTTVQEKEGGGSEKSEKA